jgi:hypothetical protein
MVGSCLIARVCHSERSEKSGLIARRGRTARAPAADSE